MSNSSINYLNTTQDADTLLMRYNVSILVGFIGLLGTLLPASIIFIILCYKLHRKLQTALILQLCISDTLQGLAASSSLGWINTMPQFGDNLCTFQSQMFQIGNLTSAITSLFIVLYVWLRIHSLQFPCLPVPGKKFGICAIIIAWGFSILMDIIGWGIYAGTGVPFYTPVGFRSWCWISEKFPLERMMLHYTWIIAICFLLAFLYSHVIYTIRKTISIAAENQSSTAALKKANLAKKMIGFPIIFTVAFMPLGIDRLVYSLSDGRISFPAEYSAVAICILVSNGIWNALLYGYSRKLFHKLKDSLSDSGSKSKTSTKKDSESIQKQIIPSEL